MLKKLTIELVPQTCFFSNLRSELPKKEWDKIRKKSYELAGNKCEICGDVGTNQGVKHKVECHEIWNYNDVTHEQKLIGLQSLCSRCHQVKHTGLAQLNGKLNEVIKQLMDVNQMSFNEALTYIDEAFIVWEKRSKHTWTTNIDYIKDYDL